MPESSDDDPRQKDDHEPTSSYLASELGALWAFLSSRLRQPGVDPADEEAPSSKRRDTTRSEQVNRDQGADDFRAELLAAPMAFCRRQRALYLTKKHRI